MKALDVVEQLNEGLMDQIETILGNKPAPEFDWR
jgi:hypothetical protein